MRMILLLMIVCMWVVPAVVGQPLEPASDEPFVVVLGIAQDGGYPQAGCRKACCTSAWFDPAQRRHVSSIAIVDPKTKQRWIIDATPDFREQLRMLDEKAATEAKPGIDGILLTHAHIGHYAGLVHLGREVMGTKAVPVYAMPRMRHFLENNGPWDQLIRLGNIEVRPIEDGVPIQLNDRITVTPFLVPHRDEYTETVGYRIDGPTRSVIYISDIDKWDRWDTSIIEALSGVSAAWLDATFYMEGEIPGRSMADIPHPFIEESMALFDGLPDAEKAKVRFIHLNHTNPVMYPHSPARRRVEAAGYRVAEELEVYCL